VPSAQSAESGTENAEQAVEKGSAAKVAGFAGGLDVSQGQGVSAHYQRVLSLTEDEVGLPTVTLHERNLLFSMPPGALPAELALFLYDCSDGKPKLLAKGSIPSLALMPAGGTMVVVTAPLLARNGAKLISVKLSFQYLTLPDTSDKGR